MEPNEPTEPTPNHCDGWHEAAHLSRWPVVGMPRAVGGDVSLCPCCMADCMRDATVKGENRFYAEVSAECLRVMLDEDYYLSLPASLRPHSRQEEKVRGG